MACGLKLAGRLRVCVVGRGWRRVLDGPNLVVNAGKAEVALLLAGNPAGSPVAAVAAGTGTATPTSDDVAIANPTSVAVSGVTHPAPRHVQFAFGFGAGALAGKNIQEFGLMLADGTLFARTLKAVGELGEDAALSGLWTIYVLE